MPDYSNWTLGNAAALANYNGGSLAGSGTNNSAAYGGIPNVPNPINTQGSVLGGNLSNLSALGALTTGLTTQNAGAAKLPYDLNLPQYGAMTGQASDNIMAELQGKLPQDVLNLLSQQGAERGIMTGSPGSPNSNAALLRSLGLNSLDMTSRGNADLTGAIGRTPTGQPFNPASMLVSPDSAQNWQYLANEMSVAPVPAAAAGANMAAIQAGINQGRGGTAPGTGTGVASSRYNSLGLPANGVFGATGLPATDADNSTASWYERTFGTPYPTGGGVTAPGAGESSYTDNLQELLRQGYSENEIMAMSPTERQSYVEGASAPAIEPGGSDSGNDYGGYDMSDYYAD